MTDDLYVSPVARTPAVRDVYAIEGQVAMPEAGESNSHTHRAKRTFDKPGFRARGCVWTVSTTPRLSIRFMLGGGEERACLSPVLSAASLTREKNNYT